MENQANKLKSLVKSNSDNHATHVVAITSGKGGVGKSTVSANMANVLSDHGYKVGLLDADIGLANLDVILNVRIQKTLLHVLKGECTLEDIIIPIKPNLFLIPGESGDEILKYNDQFIYERFFEEAKSLDGLDFLIIDTGAGIGETIQIFLEAADEVVIVTVPDPAAITDAYATIKVTSKVKDSLQMILNMTRNEKEAQLIFEKIKKVAMQNIGPRLELSLLGKLPEDKGIARSIKQRTLFTNDSPSSAASMDMKRIVNNLVFRLERKVLDNKSDRSFGGFFKRLMEQF
jgi:flagellar biosynthesis protein FlhG